MVRTLADIFGEDLQPGAEDLAPAPGTRAPVDDVGGGRSLEQNLRLAQAASQAEVQQLADVRTEQARSLAQHQQYAQGLQQRQDEVNLRAQDLQVADRAIKMFDTRYPKAAREFLFRGLVRSLGADPKADSAREMWRLIGGLDPDSASAVRSSIASQLSSAGPGQVVQIFRGALRGEVDPLELFSAVSQQPPQLGASVEGAGRAALYAEHGPPMMAGTGDVQPRQGQVHQPTTRPGEMIPEMADRLGYGTAPITNDEAIAQGYRGPTTPKEQLDDLQARQTAEQDRYRLLDRFIAIEKVEAGSSEVSPNPEIPYLGRVPTFSQYMRFWYNSLPEWSKNLALDVNEAIYGADADLSSGRVPGSPDGRYSTGGRISSGTMPREEMHRDRASRTDQIEGFLAGMRFDIGRAYSGVRPHGLSQEEGRDLMNGIAVSDAQARLALMKDRAKELFADTSYNGGRAFDLRPVSNERLQSWILSEITPANMVRAAQEELASRHGRGTQPTRQTPAEPQQRGALTPVPGTVVTEPRQPTRADAQPTEAQRLRAADAERIRTDREWVLEQRELYRESARRDIDRLKLDEQRFKADQDWRKYQKARQERKDAEERFEKIQSLFAQIGRLIASGPRGGGGGGSTPSMGGDQDASAFKLAPRPQRTPPRPIPHTPGQGFENVRRRAR